MAIGGRFGGDLGFSSPAWLPGTRSEGEEEEFDWIAAMLWVQSFFLLLVYGTATDSGWFRERSGLLMEGVSVASNLNT